jgi:glyoxylase-like metal-dependent hydrolase (beta-lactamase superfamily II)
LRKWILALFGFCVLVGVTVAQRHLMLVFAMSLLGAPGLLPAGDEGPEVRWHDDYFTVQALGPGTYAIGEPRYYQKNYSYLIAGTERAILFDAGPGYRDIRPVALSLTDLPITFIPSHFHYDHVGNEITFEHVAVIGLPGLRARAPEGRLQLSFDEHLGFAEGFEAPELLVDEWLEPGESIDLGGRVLEVLYSPGHTEDSISLLEPATGMLFTGDFIYPGPLFAFLPNSGMGDYLQGAATLLRESPSAARLFGAHRSASPGAPELSLQDVADLQAALYRIQSGELEGEGFYPRIYPINANFELHAEPPWLQEWAARNPEFGSGQP